MTKQKLTLDDYNQMPVSRAVVLNAVPAMVAMLMVLIYNLADTFFIAQTHDAYQVAAVSLATPVFLLFMAVGTVFGIGGTSVISRAMGEGRPEYAKKVCAFCFWACIVVGALMTALFLLFLEPLMVLLGTSADTYAFAKTYMVIVFSSGIVVLLNNCYSNVLRAEGRVTEAMTGQIIGNLLNLVLDPMLILVLGMEIQGAAIATVMGNLVAAGYYLYFFLSGQSMLGIHIRDFAMGDKICTGVLAVGIPAALGSTLMSISNILVNRLMSEYGDMELAGIGVTMKITMVTGMLAIGIGHGVQPLIGYCFGARDAVRQGKILRFSIVFSFGVATALTVLCYLFTPQLVGVFLSNEQAYACALRFARIQLATSCLFGVYYVMASALQAIGAGVASLINGISRQGLIYIPVLFILQAAMGMIGLVWAQPVADVLSLGLVTVLYRRATKRLMKNW